jgi:predicted phosphodiesterase
LSLPRVISQDENWLRDLAFTAQRLSRILESSDRYLDDVLYFDFPRMSRERFRRSVRHSLGKNDEYFSSETVARLLEPLREFFEGYSLYALVLGERNTHKQVDDFFQRAAMSERIDTFVAMPMDFSNFSTIVDPLPLLNVLAESSSTPPLVVFWTSMGSALALPLEKSREVFSLLEQIPDRNAQSVEAVLRECQPDRIAKRILHISDLHLGCTTVQGRRHYLKTHLKKLSADADRIVATGDLFDSPDESFKQLFLEFRDDVRAYTKKELIVVPGNHDVRPRGIMGRNYEPIVDLGFVPLVCDDELRTVFLCFNSNENGMLARGHISNSQRLTVATQLEDLERRKPETSQYTKICLVHHHPIKYADRSTDWYQRIGRGLFGNSEQFEELENAAEFMQWCTGRSVSLVLHGHKHIPRRVIAERTARQQTKEITVIGCGSTSGVKGSPLCYDVVYLDPDTGRFNIKFFQDDSNDGAGFGEVEMVAIDLRQSR